MALTFFENASWGLKGLGQFPPAVLLKDIQTRLKVLRTVVGQCAGYGTSPLLATPPEQGE